MTSISPLAAVNATPEAVGIYSKGIASVWPYDKNCTDPVFSTIYDCVTKFAEKCAVLSGCDGDESLAVASAEDERRHHRLQLPTTSASPAAVAASSIRREVSIFSLALKSALARNVCRRRDAMLQEAWMITGCI